MAGKAQATATDEAPVSSLLQSMNTETKLEVPLRGRGFDPDVVAIRQELEKCQTEGTARSFSDVDQDDRETFARKIRSAGAMNPEIKVATRYVKHTRKLIWGPEDVLNALAGKAPKKAS